MRQAHYDQEQTRRIRDFVAGIALFYRDTTLKNSTLASYQPGVLMREPTFCDATYKRGCPLGPVRYLIMSPNARCFGQLSAHPEWGLCVWSPGSFFKVIGKVTLQTVTQVALLEIPSDLLDVFGNDRVCELELDLAELAEADLRECIQLPRLPELDNPFWLDRLRDPIGVANDGSVFALGRSS